MGFDEDRIELTGSKLEKLLYRLKEVGAGIVARNDAGEWVNTGGIRPATGEYYEVISMNEIRHYAGDGSGTFTRRDI